MNTTRGYLPVEQTIRCCPSDDGMSPGSFVVPSHLSRLGAPRLAGIYTTHDTTAATAAMTETSSQDILSLLLSEWLQFASQRCAGLWQTTAEACSGGTLAMRG
jgi:hypothetical protein